MDTHIIRRQFVEVEAQGTESGAHALHQTLASLCHQELNPAIERLLDRVVPADEYWVFDRLEIDAGSISSDRLDPDFVDAVTRAIERFLRENGPSAPHQPGALRRFPSRLQAFGHSPGDSHVRIRSEAQTLHIAFLQFLETGLLPWWFSVPPGKTLEALIYEAWRSAKPHLQPEAFALVLRSSDRSPVVLRRLVLQFSTDFLNTLLAAYSERHASIIHEILAWLDQRRIDRDLRKTFSRYLWQTAFAMAFRDESPTQDALFTTVIDAFLGDGTPLPPVLVEDIVKSWPNIKHSDLPVPKPLQKTVKERRGPVDSVELDQGVFVNCAGVVLLHPFLPRLFEAVGIAHEDKLLLPERALCLLHFLATGQRIVKEYDLLLPKLLCNFPLEAPVDSDVELNAAEEEEAIALLTAVIGHWDALGNTSIDGLRGTFLVRPGKLTRRVTGDVLQVEQQSFDILMDRLPWGIGLIQLPWMQERLWVEWRF